MDKLYTCHFNGDCSLGMFSEGRLQRRQPEVLRGRAYKSHTPFLQRILPLLLADRQCTAIFSLSAGSWSQTLAVLLQNFQISVMCSPRSATHKC